MKRIMPHLFLFSCILFIHALLMDRFPLTSFVICTAFAIYRCKDKTWIVLALFLALQNIDFYKKDVPQITSGKVIETKDSYAIVKQDGYKLLIYTDALLPYNAVVSFDGTPEEMKNFVTYCSVFTLHHSSKQSSSSIFNLIKYIPSKILVYLFTLYFN